MMVTLLPNIRIALYASRIPAPRHLNCVTTTVTVEPSGQYMYRTVVTICTASLTFSNPTFCPHSVFMYFVWIWEQTAIISISKTNDWFLGFSV
jgi:hypothetical protein